MTQTTFGAGKGKIASAHTTGRGWAAAALWARTSLKFGTLLSKFLAHTQGKGCRLAGKPLHGQYEDIGRLPGQKKSSGNAKWRFVLPVHEKNTCQMFARKTGWRKALRYWRGVIIDRLGATCLSDESEAGADQPAQQEERKTSVSEQHETAPKPTGSGTSVVFAAAGHVAGKKRHRSQCRERLQANNPPKK